MSAESWSSVNLSLRIGHVSWCVRQNSPKEFRTVCLIGIGSTTCSACKNGGYQGVRSLSVCACARAYARVWYLCKCVLSRDFAVSMMLRRCAR